ncbi:PREDICTED: palmitoyltransferase ZDHHC3-like [Elephantulus edwardii]|uniref:palmitoyltransferase ZDHHC3-like n=1 Tax=Elephantulus edwardii TaxID=28737 RepID=UPI0003F0949A|nr:PREDICTED: palmitoyltransferase ZDHHC3-like [Elephantulus edwardii]
MPSSASTNLVPKSTHRFGPRAAIWIGPRWPPSAQHHRVWFVRDALGIAFAVGTWGLVLSAAGVLVYELLLPAQNVVYAVVNGVLFHLLVFLGLASHARTMLTDPGSVRAGDAPWLGAPQCQRCGSSRPPRAHHCRVCGCCIRKMDHHCPWVNNCVGEDNQKYFVLFTLYTGLASLHALLLLGVSVLRAYARGEWDTASPVSPRGALIFLFLVSVKGLLFTSTMFGTQMHAICTDRTSVELLQRQRAGGKGTKWMNLKVVFGRRVSVAWINPFASQELQSLEAHHDVV